MRKNQKIIFGFLCLFLACMLLGVWMREGRTQVENVLYIGTPQELQEFSQSVNAGNTYQDTHVMLTCDVDMSEVPNFTPIGMWDQGNYFYGIFDGNGYAIKNLTILPQAGVDNLGLFGSLGGVICNLTIENCHIEGSACGAFACIAIGDENTAILNCALQNYNIDAIYTDIIGGQFGGIVENCVIDGQGNVEELNHNLKKVWIKQHMVPVNQWQEGEQGPELSQNKTEYPTRIYMTIPGVYDGEIEPMYIVNQGGNVFCAPSMRSDSVVVICLEFADGRVAKHEVALPTDEATIREAGEEYIISFLNSENTGTVFLDTGKKEGFEVIRQSQDNMLPGMVHVLDESGALQYAGALERFVGRGNDSWLVEKQSFGFKLWDNGDILGLGRDKDFVLIPGYRDSSLLTYQVIWDLCKEMDWDYALSGTMVQLYVNGEYWGMYFLAEKAEAGIERIPVREAYEETGGFVFEYDNVDYEEIDVRIVTDKGNSYTFVSPVIPSESQKEYALNLWNEFEEALYSEDGYNELGKHYTEYADLESLAAQWLFYEFNREHSVWSSVYFYKDVEGSENAKIHAFHPWDVEHACLYDAEYRRMMETGDQFTNGFWVAMASHEDFQEELRRQWEERFVPALYKLLEPGEIKNDDGVSSLSYYANRLEKASKLNELRWGEEQSIATKAEALRSYMEIRIPYLSDSLYREEFFRE